jgi:hypothetical protein
MYYEYNDYVENNRQAIDTESWIEAEWREELQWFKNQLTIETDKAKLANHRKDIKRLEKMLGEYQGEYKD